MYLGCERGDALTGRNGYEQAQVEEAEDMD